MAGVCLPKRHVTQQAPFTGMAEAPRVKGPGAAGALSVADRPSGNRPQASRRRAALDNSIRFLFQRLRRAVTLLSG